MSNLPADPRIQLNSPDKAVACLRSLRKNRFVCSIAPGDEFAPHALACLAEEAHRSPACRLIYADDEERTQAGTLVQILKPRRSRMLSNTHSYLGRAVFIAVEIFSDWSDEAHCQFVQRNQIPLSVMMKLSAKEVGSIRRVLLTRAPRRSIQAPPPRA